MDLPQGRAAGAGRPVPGAVAREVSEPLNEIQVKSRAFHLFIFFPWGGGRLGLTSRAFYSPS